MGSSITHYVISEYTLPGAEKLLRLLTDQPYETQPPLGQQLVLAPRSPTEPVRRPGLRTELLIHASGDGDGAGLVADVALAGTPLCHRESTLPHELRTVWESLRAGPLVAAGRMLTAGRQLAVAVFDDRWGATAGVQLVGVGGIGKTAIAGRVMTRGALRADGWVVAQLATATVLTGPTATT